MSIAARTVDSGKFRQVLEVDGHTFQADVTPALGGEGTAPGPHELFDASLAACKALTAHWYAKKNGIALERVETKIERDDSKERQGTYVLRVRIAFFGALTDAEKHKLYDVVARCPVHKLMTSSTVEIETAPLETTP